MSIRDAFYGLTTLVVAGWLLYVGRSVLMPIVVALMLTYVLAGASEALARLPLLSRLPRWALYFIVLVTFFLAISVVGLIAIDNLRSIALQAPKYQENALKLILQFSKVIGLEDEPTWDTLRGMTLDRMNFGALAFRFLSSSASIGGYVVLIITYVAFLLLERPMFARKMVLVFRDTSERSQAQQILMQINRQVVTYLSTKTLVNVILGGISYVVMLPLGIEYAVFWALLIGVVNYIPYVGSIVGVAVVVAFSLLDTGALNDAVLVLILLTAVQLYVGNWIDPRLMSRSLNVSPLVVLLSLVLWSSLWGLVGAIIAVPMTSILLIVLASFPAYRFIPILLSRDGRI
jgi:AI-2 transport protein TqsA